MPDRLPLLPTLLLALPLLGCADDEAPPPGTETGPCNEERCLQGLVCLSDVCVDPEIAGGTEGPDRTDDGEPATSSLSTSGPDGGGTTTPDPMDDGGLDDGGGVDDGGAEAGGGMDDGGADSGTPDAPPATCVSYANAYCVGEVAADDCIPNITDNCADLYDWCPQWWSCLAANTCPLDEATEVCGECMVD